MIGESEVFEFLRRYEEASSSREWPQVEKLIHPAATYRFTDGDFTGLDAIRGAFEKTWSYNVADERYWLTDIKLIHSDEASALVAYDFHWAGSGDKGPFQVDGRGTQVMVRTEGRLQSIYEHLSR